MAQCTQYTWFAIDLDIVVGRNPESADYTNPRGEIYGRRWFVVGQNQDGHRVISREPSDSQSSAEYHSEYLNSVKALPNMALDSQWYPEYGSKVWREEQADEI